MTNRRRSGRGPCAQGKEAMKDGFIKVASVTPKIRVADPAYNGEQIGRMMKEAAQAGAKIVVFPELCLTGYTCGELFLQDRLLEEAKEQLQDVAAASEGLDALIFVGLPLEHENKLYNVAAALFEGSILGFVPKHYVPEYGEFYEGRYFAPGPEQVTVHELDGEEIPFGMRLLFEGRGCAGLSVGCEICEDLWAPCPPGTVHARAGATVLVNLSASDETVGKDAYRELLVTSASARLSAGYIYASAGAGESTQDLVFGGHDIIAENGTVLTQQKNFEETICYADLDIGRLRFERRKMSTFRTLPDGAYTVVSYAYRDTDTGLERQFPRLPFVPDEAGERNRRCEEILSIQAYGLKKRLEHTGTESAVVGVSGGLDSTLALLVTARAFDLSGLKRERILAVTMPCFGTTDRTYQNACRMAQALGATLKEVNIREAVSSHFEDIGHDPGNRDVTYENSQARERTQVLMDLANQTKGLVIGTGDLSELALGWATYNGDHMSMYGVNAGVPKTLIRHLVSYYADTCGDASLAAVLRDVLDTPVSPELLPPVDGKIAQKTEDLVGPYELHDFFLYYMLRFGYEPKKLYRIALRAFAGQFEAGTVKKWLIIFLRRFFSQQFKRSCLPDGPKVGSVGVSPRGDLRMPSDASAVAWLAQAEEL